jgi:hypothetical protein
MIQKTLLPPSIPMAIFSPDRKYRYTLRRMWEKTLPQVMFIGLNPSTADEVEDDPTIRRCLGFAKAWGFGSLVMTNLFAIRGTDPKILKEVEDPIGCDNNDRYLLQMAKESQLIIGAWGSNGTLLNRGNVVKRLIPGMRMLGLTKNGQPKHPLYLPKTLTPIEWSHP